VTTSAEVTREGVQIPVTFTTNEPHSFKGKVTCGHLFGLSLPLDARPFRVDKAPKSNKTSFTLSITKGLLPDIAQLNQKLQEGGELHGKVTFR
jgi:hypothetical protein